MDINWEKNPLIPVVAQDYLSGDVLMLAYMDREAFELTLESGYAHYFSRSRNRIWKKGESSNHTQEVKDILIDCDADTILLKVKQNGVACHTGTRSCFFKSILKGERVLSREVDTNSIYSIVDTLYHTILERKSDNSKRSWTKRLLEDKSLLYSKIEEEAKELIDAIDGESDDRVISESADLLYHSLVGLGLREISPDRVRQELKRRFGVSGIDEKESREG
ncbi:MAG: bifunctional phosphoribosyl-AMP cyclohydrolase/phosphoribosyl-ATP diphosphatase HisIE [Epsilonproteobacteria bacterium]|jgi:phosphoribosyl-ATP pyrophosphohydrolase/phosphoribosyl-AMP cyclohydrolase|nr:bifunctional phosphoribosyl-AMP cyclohydrolase/phosphoribosyl-ATP diphosphatase HisIE [Campylobacterota bacterium]